VFIIITGDIVRSREIPNRAEAQEILKNALYIINRKFESQIQAPFVIVWGDSFQGAIKSFKHIYEILDTISEHFPHKFRCGIGIGNISTGSSSNVLEMDGEALLNSRFSLRVATLYKLDVWIHSPNMLFNRTMNVLFLLLRTLTNQWTDTQREVVTHRKLQLTYQQIGELRGVSKQAINNILKSANWSYIEMAKRMLFSLDITDFKDVVADLDELVSPRSLDWEETRDMNGFEFQNWLSEKLDILVLSATRDKRLDGIHSTGVPCQVKKGHVGIRVLRDFASVLNDLESKQGIIFGKSFSEDARRYSDFKLRDQDMKIKLITVQDMKIR
jgi:hypothetical protein